MEFDFKICEDSECTGCFACMNKCPKKAIESYIDDVGRTIPLIDRSKCVGCGLCLSTCPVKNPLKLQSPQMCYAGQRSNKEIREKSTSGGIAAAFSEYILSMGGCVFGAAVNEHGDVKHICAETKEDIDRLRGSKYVQSDIGFSFQQAKQKLEVGKNVLFIGTPCQIAGLKHYLGKEYDNLYCVDLICHGVPPMEYLREHYRSVAKEVEIDSVTFRNPQVGYFLSLSSKERVIYSADRFHDTYFHAFFRALSYRENCYKCRYACEKRCSDITIGDFWGINRKSLKVIKSGYISVILLNNKQGEFLFEKITDKLLFEEREISEAVAGNNQLRAPSKKHKLREEFLDAYRSTQNFDLALNRIGIYKEMRQENVKGKIEGFRRKVAWKINSIMR